MEPSRQLQHAKAGARARRMHSEQPLCHREHVGDRPGGGGQIRTLLVPAWCCVCHCCALPWLLGALQQAQQRACCRSHCGPHRRRIRIALYFPASFVIANRINLPATARQLQSDRRLLSQMCVQARIRQAARLMRGATHGRRQCWWMHPLRPAKGPPTPAGWLDFAPPRCAPRRATGARPGDKQRLRALPAWL